MIYLYLTNYPLQSQSKFCNHYLHNFLSHSSSFLLQLVVGCPTPMDVFFPLWERQKVHMHCQKCCIFCDFPDTIFWKPTELLKTPAIWFCAGKTGMNGIPSHRRRTSGMHIWPMLIKMVKVSETPILSITWHSQ